MLNSLLIRCRKNKGHSLCRWPLRPSLSTVLFMLAKTVTDFVMPMLLFLRREHMAIA